MSGSNRHDWQRQLYPMITPLIFITLFIAYWLYILIELCIVFITDFFQGFEYRPFLGIDVAELPFRCFCKLIVWYQRLNLHHDVMAEDHRRRGVENPQ